MKPQEFKAKKQLTEKSIVTIGILGGIFATVLVSACSNDKKSLIPDEVVERSQPKNEPPNNQLNPPNPQTLVVADKIEGLSFEKTLQGTIYDKDYNERCSAFETFVKTFQTNHVKDSLVKSVTCIEGYDFKDATHSIPYTLEIVYAKGSETLNLNLKITGQESAENQVVELLTKTISQEQFIKFGKNLSVLSGTLQTYLRIPQKQQGAFGLAYEDFMLKAKQNFADFGLSGISSSFEFDSASEAQLRIGTVNPIQVLAGFKPETLGCTTISCVNAKQFKYRFNGTKLYFIDAANSADVYLVGDVTKEFLNRN
jgi:hypothetical protein